MSKSRQSLAERLAAVAGPQVSVTAVIKKEAAPEAYDQGVEPLKVQAPRVKPTRNEPPRETSKAAMPIPEIGRTSITTPARVGKTMIAGYFSPQMAKAVRLLAVERDTTVQALIGEGLDAVLHKHGKHPMGER
jgi:hypothetical protein